MTDSYYTIAKETRAVLYKDKGSKFLGYAFRVRNESQIKQQLELLRKEEPSANHHCYAWLIDPEQELYRSNDDGEPSNSAGNPILGQIRSQGLHNVLVVVVRYFGGTKLGVGGLIQAYKTTAAITLEQAGRKRIWITERFKVHCDYPHLNEVMRLIKREKLTVVEQVLESRCQFVLEVKKDQAENLLNTIEANRHIRIEWL